MYSEDTAGNKNDIKVIVGLSNPNLTPPHHGIVDRRLVMNIHQVQPVGGCWGDIDPSPISKSQ